MAKDKRSQQKKILAWLDFYKEITVRDMVVHLGINGATARISELRKQGYNIQDFFATGTDGVKYKTYFRGPDDYNNYVDPLLEERAIAYKEFIRSEDYAKRQS